MIVIPKRVIPNVNALKKALVETTEAISEDGTNVKIGTVRSNHLTVMIILGSLGLLTDITVRDVAYTWEKVFCGGV